MLAPRAVTLLLLHLHTPPERYITLNVFSPLLSGGIVPGCVLVLLPIDLNSVIAGYALPGAGCVGVAFLKILLIDGVRGEVMVIFHDFSAIALG